MGRFDLDTSENFNRHYPDLAKAVFEQVKTLVGQDEAVNVKVVRRAMAEYLHAWKPDTELRSLRKTLLSLAFDADYVLDLHCDCEAVMHFYTEEPCWPALAPLAHLLGSRAILLAKNSGSGPFDECLSGVWWQLAQALQAAGIAATLPQACCSTTIELRGEADVSHARAAQDAAALQAYLQTIGVWDCTTLPNIPAPLAQATPLAGSETLFAPAPGMVVFVAQVGQNLQAGDVVAEIVDPIAGTTHAVCAGVAGVFYARIRDRYITTGGELGKIAGAQAFRTGELLGA
jgi:predicted deacylase